MSDHTSNSTLVQLSFDDIEHWRDIPGYEGLYAVSDQGRVKRVSTRGGKPTNNVLRHCPHKSGYPLVFLSRLGDPKPHLIHRLVLLAFVGACPPNHETNHKNGVRTDNRLCNLEYVTHQENCAHSYHVLNRKTVLTAQQVHEIKRLLREGQMSSAEIGRLFGVTSGHINLIKNGTIWKHIA